MVSVAASNDDFQSSLGCGVCLKISGNGKPATADLDGAPPVKGILNGIVVDQDDTLSQGTTSTVNTLCQGSSHLLEFFFFKRDNFCCLMGSPYQQGKWNKQFADFTFYDIMKCDAHNKIEIPERKTGNKQAREQRNTKNA